MDERLADSIIRVDRSVCPPYPDWVREVLYSEIENIGSEEYHVTTDTELWFHDGQKRGRIGVDGLIVHCSLRDDDMIKGCFNLSDLLAIQAKGLAFYRQYFSGMFLCGWRSIVRHRSGDFYVPSLFDGGDEVVMDWRWIGFEWNKDDPAGRFKKQ